MSTKYKPFLGRDRSKALWLEYVELALDQKDIDAAKLVFPYLFPKIKPISKPMEIEVPDSATLPEKVDLLLTAAMEGKADVEAVTALITAIDKAYSIDERYQLRQDVEEIKKSLNQQEHATKGYDHVK